MMIRTMVCAHERRTTWLMALCGLLLVPDFAIGQGRIALVTLGDDQKIIAALELATVELSQNPKTVLLERDRIRTILAEQRFSLSSGTMDEGALALGQLLKAEVLVVCERISDDQSIRCVAYEATTGCRLYDKSHADPKLPAIANLVVQATRAAVAKRERFELNGLRLISFHGSRNVDLPTAQLQRLAKIQERIEQQFAGSPQFAVLERARLRFINDENKIPSVQQHAQLLASAVNVVMQFASTEDRSRIDVTLVLRGNDPKDDQVFHATVDSSVEMTPITQLVERIAEAISTRQREVSRETLVESNATKRRQEAVKLRVEAKRMQEAKAWQEALMFFEAAHALHPEQHDDLKTLIGLLDGYAYSLLKPIATASTSRNYNPQAYQGVWRNALRLLEYRLDLIALLHDRRKHNPKWPLIVSKGDGGGGWPPWHASPGAFNAIRPEETPEIYEQTKTYCDRYLTFLLDEIGQYLRDQVRSPREAAACMEMCLSSRHRQIAQLCNRWPQIVFEQHDLWSATVKIKGWHGDDPAHERANMSLLQILDFIGYDLRSFEKRHLESVRQRVADFTDNQSPFVRLTARCRLLELDLYGGLKNIAEITERVDGLIDELVPLATSPLPPDPNSFYEVRLVNGEPFPGDSRRGKWLSLIRKSFQLIPSGQFNKDKSHATFAELIEKGVFDPRLFEQILPPFVYDGMKISATNLPERITQYQQSIVRLESCEASFSGVDYRQLVTYLTGILNREQTLLDKHRGEFRGLKLWSTIEMIEGQAGWPKQRRDHTQQVIGYKVRGQELFYLTRDATLNSADFKLSVKHMSLNKHDSPLGINQFQIQGDYADLSETDRDYFDVIWGKTGYSHPGRVTCGNHNMYWSRVGHGIVVLPLDGDKPVLLNEESGLPSNFVHCIVAAAGKLYAWIGRPGKETLLVSYDPDSRQIAVLVSSERIVQKHPLDDQPAMLVRMAYYDRPRNRLVFWMGKSLWSWNLATKEGAAILDMSSRPNLSSPRARLSLNHVTAVPHRNSIVVNQGREYWAFDLNEDKHRAIPISGKWPGSPSYCAPMTWLGNQVLLRSPWGVYDYEANEYRVLDPLIQDAEPPWWWRPWCEIIEGGNRCVIWDEHHLWLAKLNNDSEAGHVDAFLKE